ncbi:MAG: prepilin-type N-terminal cleavage/methylation domain-containing protein [Sedimentisphaerales bacterium]|nr:prepilin-type N-terminal cleavage/methylation domain-containing protein [Sedimentisphaerales bacterium]HNY78127.1 prepilin-type N-terminal cleavage/methylation domain-containing protein [Sedimentisphaerales bacterium]HOC65071.1 prepilin-type N-terminal cleavage/methylation domain-containing protein [Sedimentisphaerales bacterium]HOH63165.1 prepilin-type N-terminal cleavage/methylation domain-containing protein [Sedimentisphaerales bacterium]HPY50945.1 prepilin-type N-terminal cleavage/methyl
MASDGQDDGIQPTDHGRSAIIPIQSSIIYPHAFTLIELLVVISIIVLLMALLFPALQGAKKRANAVVCQSRLHQGGLILALYTQENDGLLPYYYGSIVDPAKVSSKPPFDKDPQLALCPSAVRPLPGEQVPWGGPFAAYPAEVSIGDYRVGYKWPESLLQWRSYGLNRWTASAPPSRGPSFDLAGPHSGTQDVKGGSNVPVILDCTWEVVHPYNHDGPPPYEGHIIEHQMSTVCIDRHQGGINAAFLDWSVRKVGLKELWTLKWSRTFDTAGPWTKAGGVEPEDWPQWMRKFKDY